MSVVCSRARVLCMFAMDNVQYITRARWVRTYRSCFIGKTESHAGYRLIRRERDQQASAASNDDRRVRTETKRRPQIAWDRLCAVVYFDLIVVAGGTFVLQWEKLEEQLNHLR